MRRIAAVTICLLALPAAAQAAGGPVTAVQGGFGATAPGWSYAYHALHAGNRTVVAQLIRGTGEVRAQRLLDGRYGVPGVAYDGSTTGLSADGRTLVLAHVDTRFPVRRTHLLRLATSRLKVRDRITLRGWWTVDALSPDGRWLYLLHYGDPLHSTTQYAVRAYDLVRHRLVKAPVIDRREPDEQMGGLPVTRTVSSDGRWAYTLYDNPEEPFVHALDTATRSAACIDLPMLRHQQVGDARLALRGGTLQVTRNGAPLAVVDRRTFAVSGPEPQGRGWLSGVLTALAGGAR